MNMRFRVFNQRDGSVLITYSIGFKQIFFGQRVIKTFDTPVQAGDFIGALIVAEYERRKK